MSTLQVGNIHFESTANNRLQFDNLAKALTITSNTMTLLIGPAYAANVTINSTAIALNGANVMTTATTLKVYYANSTVAFP